MIRHHFQTAFFDKFFVEECRLKIVSNYKIRQHFFSTTVFFDKIFWHKTTTFFALNIKCCRNLSKNDEKRCHMTAFFDIIRQRSWCRKMKSKDVCRKMKSEAGVESVRFLACRMLMKNIVDSVYNIHA